MTKQERQSAFVTGHVAVGGCLRKRQSPDATDDSQRHWTT